MIWTLGHLDIRTLRTWSQLDTFFDSLFDSVFDLIIICDRMRKFIPSHTYKRHQNVIVKFADSKSQVKRNANF